MKKKKKKKNHVPLRMNVLFLGVFLLFSVLIFRLGFVQIVDGEEYHRAVSSTENVTAKLDAPRGKIYDDTNQIAVDNKPIYSITYTRNQKTTPEEIDALAKKLSLYISKSTKSLTDRDKKDYFIYLHKKEMEKRVSASERKKLSDKAYNQRLIDSVTKKDLASLTKKQLKVLAIKSEMMRGYALSPQRVKMGATQEEIAVVSEHLNELPGVDVKPDAQRTYPFKGTFKELFGQVKSIPENALSYYQSHGNDRTDLIGTSFIEAQYESLLRGKKSTMHYVTNKSGKPVGNPDETDGTRGNDISLTVNLKLQKQVENIIEKRLKQVKSGGTAYANRDLTEAYVVMMNPKTGAILSMAGKQYNKDTGNYKNAPYGAVYNSFAMGSAVKGATVLTGLQSGAITPSTHFYDAPLVFGDGRKMKSFHSLGNIGPVQALEASSNVYMWNIAMKLAGYDYPHKRYIDKHVEQAFRTLRNSYSQFGLGVSTGVDLPSEATGYNTGMSDQLAQAMFFAIGQFDTYTPLQMAQYVSTIANNGYRMQPHFLKEVREPSVKDGKLGKLLYKFEPNVLNRLEMPQRYIDVVQQGFRQVMIGSKGTAAGIFRNKTYNPAGKTGTAEVDKKSGLDNKTLVSYAPYNNPEVAISVVVPKIREGQTNSEIASDVLDTYFKMKQKGELDQ
ncbi:penicillin-binding protein transpeptidase [Fictibacillus macauensis ZFHKF-1]|uniref:Penicillin-binding protein transpeptidase n=1 Tax=Fictibacillus macauensis ZFHKF-1 TaxID=1196324 RepID=I8UEE6_9BACL|nr:penicillin-binding protein 2 [Fictibacillus macauensis]EIT85178.1 penicillin-binding protein transpeptidase [Fictibacillus macauensis ZFHKF-1]